MRAAQLYGTEDVRIENLADLQPSDPAWPNRVLVDVEWCGLCGSDLHGFTHGSFSRFYGLLLSITLLLKGIHELTLCY